VVLLLVTEQITKKLSQAAGSSPSPAHSTHRDLQEKKERKKGQKATFGYL
jgi:hypothetical protein